MTETTTRTGSRLMDAITDPGLFERNSQRIRTALTDDQAKSILEEPLTRLHAYVNETPGRPGGHPARPGLRDHHRRTGRQPALPGRRHLPEHRPAHPPPGGQHRLPRHDQHEHDPTGHPGAHQRLP
ncbi:hypothetical protein [Parascardovia denticolens]|uniref:hypothetical protein n=1 Tax=Parascardovia denticolens TaxID=78258 RepID=UPI001ED8C6B8|nr:hypothetical protein [Parascardovia denticolens]